MEEVTTEKHGGPAFIATNAKLLTVGEMLDSLESNYKTHGKDTPKFQSHLKR